jgi:transposase
MYHLFSFKFKEMTHNSEHYLNLSSTVMDPMFWTATGTGLVSSFKMGEAHWREDLRRNRRNHSSDFKAKVELAALKEDRTMSELADQFNVHPNQIQSWKKQLVESAVDLFSRRANSGGQGDEDVKALHAKIGQLTMENDFLEHGLTRTHGPRGTKW